MFITNRAVSAESRQTITLGHLISAEARQPSPCSAHTKLVLNRTQIECTLYNYSYYSKHSSTTSSFFVFVSCQTVHHHQQCHLLSSFLRYLKYYENWEKIGISLVRSHHNMMYVGYHLSEVETEFAFKISWSVIWWEHEEAEQVPLKSWILLKYKNLFSS